MKNYSSWNTWDVNCLNAVMKIPEAFEVRISLYDEVNHYLQENMLWRNVQNETLDIGPLNENVKRLGIHHPLGHYFDMDLKYKDYVFTTTFASEEDCFVYKVEAKENKNIKLFINGLFRWNGDGSIKKEDGKIIANSGEKQYVIEFTGNMDNNVMINTSCQGYAFHTGEPVYIRCNNDMSLEDMENFIIKKRQECELKLAKGSGWLKECPEAVMKGVLWNTIYEPIKNRICTPVARTWCTGNGSGFGSYVLFEWDTFFASTLCALQDEALAYHQIHSIMQEITTDGFIPNYGAQRNSSVDRSQPPVGAYCLLRLYKQFGNPEILRQYYEDLKVWNLWWIKHRDGNQDGLLEWGSDSKEDNTIGNTMQDAMYESGLDNSPMYDSVLFNADTFTMELMDVGLNALYAMDCWALAEIAKILKINNDKKKFLMEYERISYLINKELWNEEMGIYCNKFWDGSFSTCLSPTNFYPLIAGVATRERAERMINEHLTNTEEFWGEYVIPSISKKEPAFLDNDYWRGRIWGPMNFLVAEGIKRYGYYDISYEFAKKSRNLFMKEWMEENHIHENYNSITGDGDDKKNADALYTWGALLGEIAVNECIEAQAWDGIRIGNLSGEECGVTNYPIKGKTFNVQCSRSGIHIIVDGKKLLESEMPIRITKFHYKDNELNFDVVSNQDGYIYLYDVIKGRVTKNGALYDIEQLSAVLGVVTI